MKRLIAHTIIVLLCVGIFNPFTDYVNELEDTQDVSFNSSAVRIDITSPEFSMTADEVITFTATLYDSVNSVVAGEVSWSSSNGTITDDGTFYPWSSGVISIQATHGTLSTIYNMTVEAGIGQSIEISINSANVLVPNTLTANLLDARGNPKPTLEAVWTVDGDYIGQGTPQWVPQDIGEYHVVARLYQMETSEIIEVVAGNPHEFIFPNGMQIQSGGIVKLNPSLVDINGFEMSNTLAGPLNTKLCMPATLTIVPSGARLPFSPTTPPVGVIASFIRYTTSWFFGNFTPRTFCFNVFPVTVRQSPFNRPLSSSSLITIETPPTLYISVAVYFPPGIKSAM